MDINVRIFLDDEQKALLSRELGINIDSDLFDPRYDYIFKRIFSADSEESKQALIDFLNSALCFPENEKIVDLTVINSEMPVDDKRHKRPIFDVRVTFNNEEQAIVEMQLRPKDDFKKRSLFLISRAYSSQRLSGLMFRELKKCYLICITNFTLFNESKEFYSDFMYRNSTGIPLTDDVKIVFLELSKIDRLLNKPVEELNNVEMWALFLRFASDKDKRDLLNRILNRKEGIKMAAQILKTISKDEKERLIYESQLLYEADLAAEWSYRERTAREAGKAEGLAEAVKALLISGETPDKIAKLLMLSLEEVLRIKSSLVN